MAVTLMALRLVMAETTERDDRRLFKVFFYDDVVFFCLRTSFYSFILLYFYIARIGLSVVHKI